MNEKRYLRFRVIERIEHWILFLSFTTLAVTGLPQKYASAGISQAIISGLGGIEAVRIIHRVAATIFILEAIYHLVMLGYKLYVRRVQATMLPGIKDATDAIQAAKYNLGLSTQEPKLPRYNFAEKAEYWAMIWGLVLMGLTGFMLWNPLLTTRILPGDFIPAAKAAHGYEALLAVLAIILWHFYNVHIKFWNWSMIKGSLSEHQMEEEHGQELQDIEAGRVKAPTATPEELRKRKMLYFPIATVVSLALVFGIYWLVTAEQTAITTIPAAEPNVPIFSPVTPTPAPTAAATETSAAPASGGGAAATWDGGIGALFQDKCGSCHGPAAMGGLALDTYANAMKGGSTGPVIVAGDPDKSPLVDVQKKGGHAAEFSPEELQQVIDWIKAGALEK
ncbi:MAG TPA: cytochrome b/b6 domain-containing protein [Anaerolineales bacterium]